MSDISVDFETNTIECSFVTPAISNPAWADITGKPSTFTPAAHTQLVATITDIATYYEPKKGADDNYVTDAEKIVIGNTSGTNTGDQTLPVKASGAEITTGTDDAKFATPKAIKDAGIVAVTLPVKATGAELVAGTDDAKFATAKAMADGYLNMPMRVMTQAAYDGITPDAGTLYIIIG